MHMRHERDGKENKGFSFLGLLGSGIVFCLLTVVLLAVQKSVIYRSGSPSLAYVDKTKAELVHVEKEADTLIIWEDDAAGSQGFTAMSEILSQMKVPFESENCEEVTGDILAEYKKDDD